MLTSIRGVPGIRVRGGLGALLYCAALLGGGPAAAFDHGAWDALVRAHVHWIRDGRASAVDYAGFGRERARLEAYLAALAAVPAASFDTWPEAERLAFLINAYNAYTVQRVLERYPDLESFRELRGGWLTSPWRVRFAPLLGAVRSLDEIEHELIRGRFHEPRIHFALNCASVGCPALRPEAYSAARLDAQLEDQVRRFLRDRERNRVENGRVLLSPIFKWYAEDFAPLERFLAAHATDLGLDAEQAAVLAAGRLFIDYGDYDWRLNDLRHSLP
ncbi:MAG: hypothetical protein KatS3mg121_0326 [Gammaproteobacteria bacterium]|nr:MAG: hypothetical protein KatS3mg121_0326 [Gammaproteobacteria bacterium]